MCCPVAACSHGATNFRKQDRSHLWNLENIFKVCFLLFINQSIKRLPLVTENDRNPSSTQGRMGTLEVKNIRLSVFKNYWQYCSLLQNIVFASAKIYIYTIFKLSFDPAAFTPHLKNDSENRLARRKTKNYPGPESCRTRLKKNYSDAWNPVTHA